MSQEGSEGSLSFNEYYAPSIECLLYYQYLGSYDEVSATRAHLASTPQDDFSKDPAPVTINYPYLPWNPTSSEEVIITTNHLLGKSLAKDELTGILCVNIELYQLADMYFLPELQQLAAKKLLAAEQYFVKSGFDDVLGFLWDNTTDDDVPLRLAVYQRCLRNHAIIKLFPKIDAKLKELVGFAAWEAAKMLLIEEENNKEQMRSAALAQADASAERWRSEASVFKQNLAGVRKASNASKRKNGNLATANRQLRAELDACKINNRELETQNGQLQVDLDDIKFEWHHKDRSFCPECRYWSRGTQWTQDRNQDGRLKYRCVCGAKQISRRQ